MHLNAPMCLLSKVLSFYLERRGREEWDRRCGEKARKKEEREKSGENIAQPQLCLPWKQVVISDTKPVEWFYTFPKRRAQMPYFHGHSCCPLSPSSLTLTLPPGGWRLVHEELALAGQSLHGPRLGWGSRKVAPSKQRWGAGALSGI